MENNKLFDCGNGLGKKEASYSSTKYTELTSTTFSFMRRYYCIHCGQKASPVQSLIADFDDYTTDAYRCDCDGALNEMATNLAFSIGQFPESLNPQEKFPNVTDEILTSIIKRQKSFSMHMFNGKSGDISQGRSKDKFMTEHKFDINLMNKDSYYSERPLYLFMTKVKEAFKTLNEKSKKLHVEKLEFNAIILLDKLPKDKKEDEKAA